VRAQALGQRRIGVVARGLGGIRLEKVLGAHGWLGRRRYCAVIRVLSHWRSVVVAASAAWQPRPTPCGWKPVSSLLTCWIPDSAGM